MTNRSPRLHRRRVRYGRYTSRSSVSGLDGSPVPRPDFYAFAGRGTTSYQVTKDTETLTLNDINPIVSLNPSASLKTGSASQGSVTVYSSGKFRFSYGNIATTTVAGVGSVYRPPTFQYDVTSSCPGCVPAISYSSKSSGSVVLLPLNPTVYGCPLQRLQCHPGVDISAYSAELSVQYRWRRGGSILSGQTSSSLSSSAFSPGNSISCDVKVVWRKGPQDGTLYGSDYVTGQAYTVPTSQLVSVSASVTPVSCYGGTNGAISLTVQPSGASIDWADSTSTSRVRSGLSAGSYTVTATDSNMCSVSRSISVTQPPRLSVSLTETPVKCHGDASGQLVASVVGGTPAYNMVWKKGTSTVQTSSLTLSGQAVGLYSITVTDRNLCTASETKRISQPAVLSIAQASAVDAKCKGSATGRAQVTVSGGVGPHTVEWRRTGQSGVAVTGLSSSTLTAGTYQTTVTDKNGCSDSVSIVIGEPSALVVTAGSPSHLTCFNSRDGNWTVGVSGGTGPYGVRWTRSGTSGVVRAESDQSAGQQSLVSQPAGQYTCTVTDAMGCTDSVSEELTQPAKLVGTGSITHARCFQTRSGAVNMSVVGGTSPYRYTWTAAAGAQAPATLPTERDLMSVGAGVYGVTVQDSHSCAHTSTYTVVEPPLLEARVDSVQNATCSGKADGVITVSVEGGTAPYQIQWVRDGTPLTPSHVAMSGTTITATGQLAGQYVARIVDAQGCEVTAAGVIGQPESMGVVVTPVAPLCHGSSNGQVSVVVQGGTLPYSITWLRDELSISEAAAVASSNATNSSTAVVQDPVTLLARLQSGNTSNTSNVVGQGSSVTGLMSGAYALVVSDRMGCTVARRVWLGQPATVTVRAVATPVLCNGDATGAAQAHASGGVGEYAYEWHLVGISGLVGGQPLSSGDMLGAALAGQYEVTVRDSHQCSASNRTVISEPPALGSSFARVTNPTCHGAWNGEATLDATGGVTPYQAAVSYGLSSSALSSSMAAASSSSSAGVSASAGTWINTTVSGGGLMYRTSGLEADQEVSFTDAHVGWYTSTVVDANGCMVSREVQFTQPEPLEIVDARAMQISCHGLLDGYVAWRVEGGTGPYKVEVEQAMGPDTWQDVLETTSTARLTACEPGSSSLPCSTIPPYRGAVGDALPSTAARGGIAGRMFALTGMGAGRYRIRVTDAQDCATVSVSELMVTDPSPLHVWVESVLEVTNPLRGDPNDNGEVRIGVSGGTEPMQYLWWDGSVAQNATDQPPGNASVQVTDGMGCTEGAAATVPLGPKPVIDAREWWVVPEAPAECILHWTWDEWSEWTSCDEMCSEETVQTRFRRARMFNVSDRDAILAADRVPPPPSAFLEANATRVFNAAASGAVHSFPCFQDVEKVQVCEAAVVGRSARWTCPTQGV